MKNIPNKIFPASGPEAKPTTVAELLEQCLTIPPQGGFDFTTMRARNRVSSALDAVKGKDGGEIALEDADYATAQEAIKATRWVKNDKHLLEFAGLFGL